MFILYLDESGYHAQSDYFVPAGLAIFYREEGRIHGLVNLTRDYECQCPACLSRRD